MAGGAASYWMRREGNLGDTYSQATLFACSNFSLDAFRLHLLSRTRTTESYPIALCPCLPHPPLWPVLRCTLVSALNLTYPPLFFFYEFLPTLYAFTGMRINF